MKFVMIAAMALALGACAQSSGARDVDAAVCQGAGETGSRVVRDCREQREAQRADAARRMANSTPITGYGPMPGGRF